MKLNRGGTALLYVAAVSVLVVAWASTYSAVKLCVAYSPPLLLAALRALIAGGIMAVIAWRSRQPAQLRENWKIYGILALLNVAAFYGFQTLSLEHLSAGLTVVLIYLQPILVGLLAPLCLGESLSRARLCGLVIGFIGIVVVSTTSPLSGVGAKGVSFALGASVAWAVGTIAVKRNSGQMDPQWAVAIQFLIGGVVLLGLSQLNGEPLAFSWTITFIASLLYASIVGAAMAWTVWFWLIRLVGASRASGYVFLVPLVGLAIAAMVLGETVPPHLGAGAALVVSGIYLVNRQP